MRPPCLPARGIPGATASSRAPSSALAASVGRSPAVAFKGCCHVDVTCGKPLRTMKHLCRWVCKDVGSDLCAFVVFHLKTRSGDISPVTSCSAVRTHVRTRVCVCVCHNKGEWQARQATPAILQVSSSKHNANKNTTRVRGPFHQSITAFLTEEKEKQLLILHMLHAQSTCFGIQIETGVTDLG